ncbi:unnamed protein product [Phytomonas sp. Hart1]|nr:unnamed protein product [Phytomonas sp. Hart1]|eukprot:CCW69721.1 unnamed protein product [Phytomonas sp. isolate Hart1]
MSYQRGTYSIFNTYINALKRRIDKLEQSFMHNGKLNFFSYLFYQVNCVKSFYNAHTPTYIFMNNISLSKMLSKNIYIDIFK